jgi:regulatory protein
MHKHYSIEEVYNKAREYCAFQERCHQEVRNKLFYWGLHSADVEALISQLITEGFLNEERFAKAFAGGKFRIIKWGRLKIKHELKVRKVSGYCIRQAIAEINEDDYRETLKEILAKKAAEITEPDYHTMHNKIALYAISRGFESDLVWEVVKEMFGK